MGKSVGRVQARMTWRQCGEALAHLQDSLFLDRDYWVWGNMEHRSMRSTSDRRYGDTR